MRHTMDTNNNIIKKTKILQYDESLIDSRFLCFICHLILFNVYQAECGCRYCSDCLDEVYKKDKCPNCNELFDKKVKILDKGFMKELNNILIKCAKCNWKGRFNDLEKHYKNTHSFVCEFCDRKFQSENDLSKHCDYRTGDCEEKYYECLYSHNIKCNFIGKRNDIKKHMKEAVNSHLMCVYDNLNSRIENLEVKQEKVDIIKYNDIDYDSKSIEMSIDDSGFDSHESTISSVRIDNNDYKKRLDKAEETQEKLLETIFKYIEYTEKIEKELKSCKNNLNAKNDEIIEMKKVLMMTQVSFFQLEDKLSTIEKCSNYGSLLWKITNIKEKIKDAENLKKKSIYSTYFYSHQNGYKLCVRIFLNGDDSTFGRSLSIFIVLCKSEYDALLKWPFKHKVTFFLIDQRKNGNGEHIVQSFRPDINSESFKRPVNLMNTASGIPNFCSLTKLHSQEHGYIKDDCMFIKVTVDTHDIHDMF